MDKTLQASLAISLFIHTLVLMHIPNINPLQQLLRPEKIEVTYYKARYDSIYQKENLSLKNDSLKYLIPLMIKKEKTIPDFISQGLPNNKTPELKEAALTKPEAVKKKITLPALETENIKNPSYINYFRSIRSKIKHYAYKNYTGLEEGRVHVVFIIASDGQLKEVKILDEKSTTSSSLRDIALRSIRDASPYPAFPKELDYPQKSFKVTICFELEE